MALSTGQYATAAQGMNLSKKYGLDARTEYDTVADMAAVKDIRMPPMLLGYCIETHQVYLYNKDNEKDETLGKWRLFPPEDKVFVYTKDTPAKKWIITHNLGSTQPQVTAYDQDGNLAIGNITINSDVKLTISFCVAISGVAYIRP